MKSPCIVAAFAYVCNVTIENFTQRLEQRGGLVMGTYHVQQCMDVAWDLGFVSFFIELNPKIISHIDYLGKPAEVQFPEGNRIRFMTYLWKFAGVLGGVLDNKIGHAVAWNKNMIKDPRGYTYNFRRAEHHNFDINNFIALVEVPKDE